MTEDAYSALGAVGALEARTWLTRHDKDRTGVPLAAAGCSSTSYNLGRNYRAYALLVMKGDATTLKEAGGCNDVGVSLALYGGVSDEFTAGCKTGRCTSSERNL